MKTLQYNLYRSRAGHNLMGCLVILTLWCMIALALSSWTDRNLDFWLSHLKERTVDCPFWLSALLPFVLPLILLLNVVGEIARLCV